MKECEELIHEIESIQDDRFELTENLRLNSSIMNLNQVVDLKKDIQIIDDTILKMQELFNKKGK